MSGASAHFSHKTYRRIIFYIRVCMHASSTERRATQWKWVLGRSPISFFIVALMMTSGRISWEPAPDPGRRSLWVLTLIGPLHTLVRSDDSTCQVPFPSPLCSSLQTLSIMSGTVHTAQSQTPRWSLMAVMLSWWPWSIECMHCHSTDDPDHSSHFSSCFVASLVFHVAELLDHLLIAFIHSISVSC